MTLRFPTKAAAREAVWDRLQEARVAAFPFPPHGRIPNFVGARQAAQRLFELPIWKGVTKIKVNPDAPQKPVREEALRRGIIVFVPTPRLRGGFRKLDPAKIPASKISEATSISKTSRWAAEVPLRSLPQLDLIVAGSVAVTRTGRRCGKGEGYSDIEFAILRELGHRPVPVVTTVHALQVVQQFPRERNDLPLSWIVTPDAAIRIKHPPAPPAGVDWTLLSKQDLEEMPILGELLQNYR